MSESFALPNNYAWGKVVGRVIRAIPSPPGDNDEFPEARAASGTVTFTPVQTLNKVVDADYTAFVQHETATANLDSNGRLTDASGRTGIWLIVGTYNVSFKLESGSVDGFQIAVTSEHTTLLPLDLVAEAPYVPPTGVIIRTLLVPSGSNAGRVLVGAVDGGIEWADFPVATDATDWDAMITALNGA